MNKYIKLVALKRPVLKKCSCCEKVQEVFFKAHIYDYKDQDILVGEMSLCRICGDNLNFIMGNEIELGSKVIKQFTFNK